MPPEEARKLQMEEIDRIMREFRFQPAPDARDVVGQGRPARRVSRIRDARGDAVVNRKDLLFPDAGRFRPEAIRALPIAERFRILRTLAGEEKVRDIRNRIIHYRIEKEIKAILPDFPGTP